MDEKRKEIVEVSIKLFLKYGIRSVSMDDVARELSMSKKTLYQYVKDKGELVSKVIKSLGEQTDISHFHNEIQGNAIEKHIRIFKRISKLLMDVNPSFEYDLRKYYPKQHKKFVKNRRKHVYEKMVADLNQGISEGLIRPEISVEKVVLMNIIKIEGLKETDIFEEYNYRIIDVLEELFDYQIYALGSKKGIEEYLKLKKEMNNE